MKYCNSLDKNIKTPQTQFYGMDSKSDSVVSGHKNQISKIKQLLARNLKPEFPSKNNWFVLGGERFNGFTREQVETLMEEFKNVE
jgi:hypothetical protein